MRRGFTRDIKSSSNKNRGCHPEEIRPYLLMRANDEGSAFGSNVALAFRRAREARL